MTHTKEQPEHYVANKTKHEELRKLAWTYPSEHPDGLLGKPCPVCGYKYGSAWIKEEVPEDIIDWLFSLPQAKIECKWDLSK